MTMIHDAQVFESPRSYKLLFRLYYSLIMPLLGKRNYKIITVSEYSKDQLIKYKIASGSKICVISNGVDHIKNFKSDCAILSRLKLAKKSYVVGLANLQEHKNIPFLGRVFDDERLASVKLVLIGEDSRESFESIGAFFPQNVIFAGKVTNDELKALLESALCTVLPSTTEGFGLLPLEGMLLGCPSIVSPCGALPEVCSDAAFYAPPDDYYKWATSILSLLEDDDLFKARSELGIKWASNFTWRRSAILLDELIDEAYKTGSTSNEIGA